ncbi:hypothetical protein JTB14_022425 [Gonioctena quinquepunctata]|nr:hypothetical protein JTB14_022425 [Gonioctena quinquepunctata]
MTLARMISTIPPADPSDNNTKIVLKIIQKLYDYQLIFHYDNPRNAEILSKLEARSTTWFLKDCDFLENLKRPQGIKFLHILYCNDLQKVENYFSDFSNVAIKDKFLFISNAKNIPEKKMLDALAHSGGIYFVGLPGFQLQQCCFECGENECRIKSSEIDTMDTIRNLSGSISLEGKTFSVGFNAFPPYAYTG